MNQSIDFLNFVLGIFLGFFTSIAPSFWTSEKSNGDFFKSISLIRMGLTLIFVFILSLIVFYGSRFRTHFFCEFRTFSVLRNGTPENVFDRGTLEFRNEDLFFLCPKKENESKVIVKFERGVDEVTAYYAIAVPKCPIVFRRYGNESVEIGR